MNLNDLLTFLNYDYHKITTRLNWEGKFVKNAQKWHALKSLGILRTPSLVKLNTFFIKVGVK